MGMTKFERLAKDQIMDILGQEGYPTYARLLRYFDVNLTEDPEVIGYMEPSKGRIVLNKNLHTDQISMIVRHEILHEYLTHGERAEKLRTSGGKFANLNPQLSNIAADYEISNLGYTDKDKGIARAIELNDQTLRGLVTEDDHEDWIELTYEEMLDKLIDENPQLNNQEMLVSISIGSMGDPEKRQAEDMQRQAQIIQEQQEEQANDSSNSNSERQEAQEKAQVAKSISDALDELKDDIDENNQDQSSQPLKTPEEEKEIADILQRMAKLKRELDKLKESDQLERETLNNIGREKVAQKARDLARYRKTPINRFRDSLANFMKNYLDYGRGPTWSRLNKKYVGTGLLKAGSSRLAGGKIPSVNVYFDRSGSFSSRPDKTKAAEEAIATLNKYVNRHELKVNLYYVAERVEQDRLTAERQGSGANGDAIIRHIKATRPDNVIVLTDSDADTRETVTIPGGVWILWYDTKGTLPIIGKRLTKEFLIK